MYIKKEIFFYPFCERLTEAGAASAFVQFKAWRTVSTQPYNVSSVFILFQSCARNMKLNKPSIFTYLGTQRL